MLFATKGKKKKLVETKLLATYEQLLLYMKILRANFVLCGGSNCVNQHFEILNLVEYDWKVWEGKLEPNWFERSALSSAEDNDPEQNNLDTSSDSEDENEGIYLPQSIEEETF